MKIFFTLIFSLIFSINVSANSTCNCQGSDPKPHEESHQLNYNSSQKTYVDFTDLLITEKGLFLIDSNELVPVQEVGIDENGFYFNKLLDGIWAHPKECPNGHLLYHPKEYGGCGGCANWWCVFRCKCHSPWSVE